MENKLFHLVFVKELTIACKDAGLSGLDLLNALEKSIASVPKEVDSLVPKIQHILQLAEALMPKMEDVKVKELGDMIEDEMQSTTSAIEAAAEKIQVWNTFYNVSEKVNRKFHC